MLSQCWNSKPIQQRNDCLKGIRLRGEELEVPSQTVNVKIYNQTYTIRANDGDAERTLRLAALVDQRMREIAQGALTSDSLKLAILAAILIADDLEKANARYDELNQELIERSAECAELLDQMLKGGK